MANERFTVVGTNIAEKAQIVKAIYAFLFILTYQRIYLLIGYSIFLYGKSVILAILNTECYYLYAFFSDGFSAFIHSKSSFQAYRLFKIFTTIIA